MKTMIEKPSNDYIWSSSVDESLNNSDDYRLIGDLIRLFEERETLYSNLQYTESKYGSDGREYSEFLDEVRANRIAINEFLERVKVGSPLYDALGENSTISGKTLDVIFRNVGIFFVDPELTSISSSITNEVREENIQRLTNYIFDEIHGREVVEGINTFLGSVSNKPLKKYLIKKKNEIIERHPEVENWNLGISFLGEEELAKNFAPENLDTVPFLAGVGSQVMAASNDYWTAIADKERKELITQIEKGNSFEQVYAAICLSSIRPHLDEKTNQEIVSSIQASAMYGYMDTNAKGLLLRKGDN